MLSAAGEVKSEREETTMQTKRKLAIASFAVAAAVLGAIAWAAQDKYNLRLASGHR